MRLLTTACLCLTLLSPQAAFAGPAVGKLSQCMKDSTNGKDRKDLVRWMYGAMSTHPEIGSMGAISEAAKTDANKTMGSLITRLVTQNCLAQTQAVIKEDGPQGMFQSFQALGEVAMMELGSDPSVAAAFGAYTKFMDMKKVEAILGK